MGTQVLDFKIRLSFIMRVPSYLYRSREGLVLSKWLKTGPMKKEISPMMSALLIKFGSHFIH